MKYIKYKINQIFILFLQFGGICCYRFIAILSYRFKKVNKTNTIAYLYSSKFILVGRL